MPQPSRTVLAWTPRDYYDATIDADNGDLRGAADFAEAIMRDDRVGGVLEQRTLGMLSLPSVLERRDGAPPPPVPDWPTAFPEAEQARLLAWGIVLGYGWSRRHVYVDALGTWRMQVRTWHPRWFAWRDYEQAWYLTAREYQPDGNYRVFYERIDPRDGWILYTPYGEHEPWKHGLWHRLAVPFLAKLFAIDDRARETEITSVLVGETTGLTDGQQADFLADLQGLAKDSRVVLPEGCKLSVVSRSNPARMSLFAETIAWADAAITVDIAGQIVTTEGTEGFSSGRVQRTVLASLLRAQEETFSTAVGEQCVTPWLRLATGYDGPPVYQRWQIQDAEDLIAQGYAVAQFAGALDAANAALARDGVRVDTRALLERTGLPLVAVPPGTAPGVAPQLPQGPGAPEQGAPAAPGSPAGTGQPPGLDGEELAAPGDEPENDDVAALATKMTEHAIERCEHGRVNRCPLCGIERVRDFQPGADGPVWSVAWKPIRMSAVEAA